MLSDFSCQVCEARALDEFEGFRSLGRVTSDSKTWPAGGRITVCQECGTIQKVADTEWLSEIDKIYGAYDIYHQSGGAEQPIYTIGSVQPVPRSVKLVSHLVEQLGLGQTGRLLDFGCGTGVALRSFNAVRPDWSLYGSELSDRSLSKLRQVPGFVELYTCPPEQIPKRFTLITLIHSLEHVIGPGEVLRSLADKVDEGGHLFVQVPDCGLTAYDLAIADHLTHFTLDALRFVGERAGYETSFASDSLLRKELSWIGRPGHAISSRAPDPRTGRDLLERHLAWLRDQIDTARRIAADSPRFGIFGTSISATWLFGILGERVSFFVDEDPARIGAQHMGLPIFAPKNVPTGSDVFVPLVDEAAQSVSQRLAHPGTRYHRPPETGAPFAAKVA